MGGTQRRHRRPPEEDVDLSQSEPHLQAAKTNLAGALKQSGIQKQVAILHSCPVGLAWRGV